MTPAGAADDFWLNNTAERSIRVVDRKTGCVDRSQRGTRPCGAEVAGGEAGNGRR